MLVHADVDAFFASVELRDRPELVDHPFAVVTGVVCCANYPARDRGVRAGMGAAAAVRACPELVTVEPRDEAYQQASAEVFALFGRFARRVEAGSLEEAFLAPGGEASEVEAVARALRRAAREELGLPVSVGVGRTKLLAKVASRRAKPDGAVVIGPAEERDLRAALQVEELWGVGPRTAATLRDLGIGRVADLGSFDEDGLAVHVGRAHARRLLAIHAGTDDATLRAPGDPRSISVQRTLPQASWSREPVRRRGGEIATIALDRLGSSSSLVTSVEVELRPRSGDGVLRRAVVRPATADPDRLRRAITAVLDECLVADREQPVSLVRVAFALTRPGAAEQLRLPLPT